MRLIDADELKEVFTLPKEYTDKKDESFYHVSFPIIRATIDDAPTIEAVEVVRCKDCVFFHRYGFKLEYTECRRSDCHATEDGYCCWAERREDVQESD